MALDDIWKVQVVTEVAAVATSNAFYYKEKVSPPLPDPYDVGDAWFGALSPLHSFARSSSSIVSCIIDKVVSDPQGPAYPKVRNVPGTGDVNSLPSNKAVTVSLYGIDDTVTKVLIRNSMLFAGIPEDHANENVLDNTGFNQWTSLAAAMLLDIAGAGSAMYEPQVRQRVPGPGVFYNYYKAETFIVNAAVRSVRRRTTNLCAAF